MRIRATDPEGHKVRVYLDGKPLEYCVEADDEKNYAIVLKGQIIRAGNHTYFEPEFDEDDPSEILKERLEGDVEFKLLSE